MKRKMNLKTQTMELTLLRVTVLLMMKTALLKISFFGMAILRIKDDIYHDFEDDFSLTPLELGDLNFQNNNVYYITTTNVDP